MMVDEAGVGLVPEQQFYAGMIMMFSGDTVPAGWALCNGETPTGMTNATPDLRERFVLGGSGNEVGQSGGAAVNGSSGNKSYSVLSNSISAGAINVNTQDHRLTVNQIPSHSHNSKYTWNTTGNAGGYTSITVGNDQSPGVRNLLNSAGGGQGHKHSATATQGTHRHTITTLPSYYILAFIIKL
ncbi:tail fiber protein [Shewanella sp. YLB-07]|nr:tail fiber protein [Shewanella sp. YLB-07]